MRIVKVVDPRVIKGWNEQVLRLKGHSIFHSSNWAEVLSGVYGYKPVYFTLYEAGEIKGVIPILEVDSFITGKRGVSLPFSDTCEPLVQDGSAFQSLLEAVRNYAKSNDWKYYEVRGGSQFFDTGIKPSSVFYEHKLPLVTNLEESFKALRSNTKRGIKKSVKEQIKNEVSKRKEAVEAFYRLNCLTRRRHGLPPQPVAFFKKLHEVIIQKDLGFIVNTSFEGRAVASGVFLHFGDEIIYKYGASDFSYQLKRPSYAMLWQGISKAHELGFKALNLGRTDIDNQGLRNFKLGWRPQEHEVNYYKYSMKAGRYVKDSAKVGSFYNTIFRHMPDLLLRLTGKLAYRHIA